MAAFSFLPVATPIIATADHGPIIRGQFGMIIAPPVGSRLLWWRRAYPCTFLGGIHVAMPASGIRAHDHSCSLQMLEHPFWFFHTRDALTARDVPDAKPRRSPFWSVY